MKVKWFVCIFLWLWPSPKEESFLDGRWEKQESHFTHLCHSFICVNYSLLCLYFNLYLCFVLQRCLNHHCRSLLPSWIKSYHERRWDVRKSPFVPPKKQGVGFAKGHIKESYIFCFCVWKIVRILLRFRSIRSGPKLP